MLFAIILIWTIFSIFSIQLPSIDKEKLRELASQARAAGAKQAQEAKNIYQPSNDVYFREPVKVRFLKKNGGINLV